MLQSMNNKNHNNIKGSFTQISSSFVDINNNSSNLNEANKYHKIDDKNEKNEQFDWNETNHRILMNKACETTKFNFNSELMLGKVNVNDFAVLKPEKNFKLNNKHMEINKLQTTLFTQYEKNKFWHDKTHFKTNSNKSNQTLTEKKLSTSLFQTVKFQNIPKGLMLNFKMLNTKKDENTKIKIFGEKIKSCKDPSRTFFPKYIIKNEFHKNTQNIKGNKFRINLLI